MIGPLTLAGSTAPAPARQQAKDGYVPGLDGIRALAVLAVMAFHGGLSWLPGGFLGVDSFFVLSGFLITSLLIRERLKTGRIALAAFWGRRARRLLPALLVLIVVVVLVGHALLDTEDLHLLRADALAALFYVANWRMLLRGHGGYFEQTASASPLEHTWSLGIEEQFYLLWPLLLVVVLARRVRLRLLLLVCLVGTAASAIAAAVLFHPGSDPSRVYYGTDTRAQALLVGAALAVWLAGRPARAPTRVRRHRMSRAVAYCSLVGVVLTAWAWTHATGQSRWLYQGGFLVVALATAAVIAHITLAPGGITSRVLSTAPLPALGRISYGVYLWHWPVFQALTGDRTGLTGLPLLGVRVAVTLAIAAASYVLVETPIRRRSWRVRVAVPAVAVSAAAVAAVAVAATVVPYQPGSAQAASNAVVHISVPSAQPTPGPSARPPHHKPGTPPVIDFFGDSVAWTVGAYMPKTPGIVTHVHAMQGCGIALGDPYSYIGGLHKTFPTCKYWQVVWKQRLAEDNPDVSVILLDRWELVDRVHNGRWTYVGQPDFDAYLEGQLKTAIGIVSAKGATVVLLTAPYNRRGEKPDGSLYSGDYPSRVDAWNALLRRVAAEYPAGTVNVVDLNKKVCPDGKFTWSVDGIQIRSDGTHFTPSGVRWLAPWLLPRLVAYVH